MIKYILFFALLLSSNGFSDEHIGMAFFPDTVKEKTVEGVLTKISSSEILVANSDNRYDVYDFIMSEFEKDDFEPIRSLITNYTTEQKMRVDFTVGCRDGEYIVMGIKPDAHVLVWENPNENPDTCIANFKADNIE